MTASVLGSVVASACHGFDQRS